MLKHVCNEFKYNFSFKCDTDLIVYDRHRPSEKMLRISLMFASRCDTIEEQTDDKLDRDESIPMGSISNYMCQHDPCTQKILSNTSVNISNNTRASLLTIYIL
jgi:hypothetical protein